MLLPPSSNAASVPAFLIVLFIISSMASIIGHRHKELQGLSGFGSMLRADMDATAGASADFGRLTRATPAAVFYPSSESDVAALVRASYNSSDDVRRFRIAARGNGHSVRGQSLAPGGVIVDMSSLGAARPGLRITVFRSYVDAGGEQLWIDVLQEALKYGVAPRSWTDYLYLTVGGTLSNAGISGQSFLHGPQISNVYELDVITGKGEVVTCSEHQEPDLFFAVLGGLGQFGIITRARIAVEPAPKMVRWLRLIYTDFESFTRDQERLISLDLEGREGTFKFNYVEGSLLMEHGLTNNWRSSFYADDDIARIRRLAALHRAVYCLEAARYYDHTVSSSIDLGLEQVLEGMNFEPGFRFKNEVTYLNFLNRVREGELKLRARGLWDVPHPWLNILVPRSRILDFNRGVFNGILLQHNNWVGPILIYPMNRNKWDERTSAVVPDEEVFYSIGLLRCGVAAEWGYLEQENREILHLCDQWGIRYKQYLPHYTNPDEWVKHFGPKWHAFAARKKRYDPKALLSPGQRIFSSSLLQHSTM